MRDIDRCNPSGYPDPTAHDALESVMTEEKRQRQRANALTSILKAICSLVGFEFTPGSKIKDKRSGKTYKV